MAASPVKTMTAVALFACLPGCVGPAPAPRADAGLETASALQDAFAAVAERVRRSVVCLTAYARTDEPAEPADAQGNLWREVDKADRQYPNMRRLANASGFAIDADGHILTCRHFLEKPGGDLADLVDVEMPDGPRALCRIVGTEPTLNLAVLRIEVYPADRPPSIEPVTIADHRSIRVGHWAIAVGDPLGPQRTCTAGIVAARPQRDCYQAELAATLLQASLTVHPEAYGGPLVDIHGEVMGMVVPPAATTTVGGRGFEYALPMSVATGVAEALVTANSFASPWLGFSVLNLSERRARLAAAGIAADPDEPVMGVYIDDVFDPSPASRAGIEVGDVLVKMAGQRLISVFHFQRTLYLSGIGSAVTLEIVRDGERISREVTIETRPAAAYPR